MFCSAVKKCPLSEVGEFFSSFAVKSQLATYSERNSNLAYYMEMLGSQNTMNGQNRSKSTQPWADLQLPAMPEEMYPEIISLTARDYVQSIALKFPSATSIDVEHNVLCKRTINHRNKDCGADERSVRNLQFLSQVTGAHSSVSYFCHDQTNKMLGELLYVCDTVRFGKSGTDSSTRP